VEFNPFDWNFLKGGSKIPPFFFFKPPVYLFLIILKLFKLIKKNLHPYTPITYKTLLNLIKKLKFSMLNNFLAITSKLRKLKINVTEDF